MLHIRPPQNEQEQWAFEYMSSIQHTQKGKRLIAIVESRDRGAPLELVEHCLAVETPDQAWERAQRTLGLTDTDAEAAGPICIDDGSK